MLTLTSFDCGPFLIRWGGYFQVRLLSNDVLTSDVSHLCILVHTVFFGHARSQNMPSQELGSHGSALLCPPSLSESFSVFNL